MHDNIFEKVKSALHARLDSVLSILLPVGRIVGKEYVCASLSGGYGNSCKTNLLTEGDADFNTDERWGDVITMYALIHNVDNFQAAIALASKFSIQLNLTNQKGRHSNMSTKNATNGKLIPIGPVPDTAPQPSQNRVEGEEHHRNSRDARQNRRAVTASSLCKWNTFGRMCPAEENNKSLTRIYKLHASRRMP